MNNKKRISKISVNRDIRLITALSLFVCLASAIHGLDTVSSVSTQREFRNHRLDSLLSLLPTAEKDTNTVLLYKEIGQEYEYAGQKEIAKDYYFKVRDLSKQLNFDEGYFDFASRYTDMLIKNGRYDSVIIISNQALALAQQINDKEQEAIAKTNIGNGYNMKGYFETALSYYFDALKYYEPIRDSLSMGHLYDLLQTVYWDMGRFDDAVVYGEKAVGILRHNEPPYLYNISLLNLANTYTDMYPPQYNKAEKYLKKALSIARENGYAYLEANAYLNYCELSRLMNKDENETYARLALKMGIEMNDPEIIALSQLNLGYASFCNGRYEEAENWTQESITLALEYDFKYIVFEAYKGFADLAYARHDIQAAMAYDYKADSVKNLLTNEEVLHATEELNIKYETEKKELEIERQQNVINKQNAHRFILLSGFVTSLVFLILFWRMLRLRIKRNRILAEMNATKDKFFSIISHDLKNPAIAQREALQLLINHSAGWDQQSLSQYYKELLQSADGQVELLYNLLNWAQVQTGRMPYTPTQFDLIQALRSDISLIRNTAERKGVIFDIRLPETAIVTGDSNMITTVVRNLLTNAVKFTSAYEAISLHIEKADNRYTINVCDTGTGMTKEQLRNLFQIDCQRSRKGTAGEQGSGLGLIVCKELIEKHNSQLHVESETGKGSRFWFVI